MRCQEAREIGSEISSVQGMPRNGVGLPQRAPNVEASVLAQDCLAARGEGQALETGRQKLEQPLAAGQQAGPKTVERWGKSLEAAFTSEPVRVESGQRLIERGPFASRPARLVWVTRGARKGEKWAGRERPK
jgi:hypothetical protein